MKKNKYSETEKEIIKYIEDNILFISFKEQLSNTVYNLTGNTNEDIEEKYLNSFQTIADTLRNEEDEKNNTEDIIYTMLQDTMEESIKEYDFSDLISLNLEGLSMQIFDKWTIALKAIRSTYKSQKTEML